MYKLLELSSLAIHNLFIYNNNNNQLYLKRVKHITV